MSEKTDLQEKARTLGLDDAGTIKELKARIAQVGDTPVGATSDNPDAPAGEPATEPATPATDEWVPNPEAARASFEEQMAKAAKADADKAANDRVDKTRAAKHDAGVKMGELRASRHEATTVAGDKSAEQAAKEASVPGSDPRESVFDAAPGKSLADVIERNEARARGEFGDTPAEPKRTQWFVVTDEPDLIEVARKLGLSDHAELGAINGRHSSVYGVQPGERVVLPAHYTFTDVEGVVTEGEETEELAGSEPTA